MNILLDTNSFIWWVNDELRLGRKAKADIANPKNRIFISNISLLECAIKVRIGKLKIDFSQVDQEMTNSNFLELRFDALAARQYADQKSLPQSDPFDFAITAQAISKKMTLITSDDKILSSGLDGLNVIDAQA